MQYAKPVTLNVEECDRLSFLPYLFGNDFLYAEAYVYALAQKMMPEYQGGFWHFIRLPDGGGYMMPDGDRFHLVNGENWFDRTVSADAAGIIRHCCKVSDEAAFCLIQRPYISKTLLTRRISPRGSP
ncbi:antirestriction protein [Escherichia coli]|nr:antirestriction protein [Escherichia coli]